MRDPCALPLIFFLSMPLSLDLVTRRQAVRGSRLEISLA
jgi:hypothetical protein